MTDRSQKPFDLPDDETNPAAGKTPAGPDPVDDISPSPAEVVNPDAFRHQLDEEWTSARDAYQERISAIMDEFLHKGVDRDTPEAGPAPKAQRASRSPRDGMEQALARMAQELGAYEARARSAAAAATPLALPAPTPKSKNKWIIGGAAAAFLLIAGAIALWSHAQVQAYTPLPYARTGAIAVEDGKIYIADWFRKSLYVHADKRNVPILAVESLPSNLLTGMAVHSDALWAADGLTSELVRHTPTADHRVVEKFPAPGDKPAGLVLDKGSLWTTSAAENKIYRLRADDPQEITEEFDFPDITVTALQIRDRRLWALDGKSREIYVFRLQKKLKSLATLDLDPFLRGGTPTGLAIKGRDAWIVTENPAAIVRIPLRRLKKSKESEF